MDIQLFLQAYLIFSIIEHIRPRVCGFVDVWERLLTVSHVPQGICLLTPCRIGLLQDARMSLYKARQEMAPVSSFEVEEAWWILED